MVSCKNQLFPRDLIAKYYHFGDVGLGIQYVYILYIYFFFGRMQFIAESDLARHSKSLGNREEQISLYITPY